ncbi:MAG: outer membrane lipoprotein-sorting protein [Gammaproteobacteria bacterium]|jgi:outer membrane lipoprotein-sorting protein
MFKLQLFVSTLLFSSLLAGQACAQTAEEKGLEIAVAAKAYDKGFVDFTADMEMTLKSKNGNASTRIIRIKTLEVDGDGDRSLSQFDEPADVKGTAMLTFSHGLDADDQWLYLPALKKVKRISSRNKSGPFMGSTFAFEDLGSQEVEKYTYKYLRDEACGSLQCYVIERFPAYKHSGYTRQIAWLDQEGYRMVKAEFYDRKKSLLKTLEASDFQQYLDHYWRPGKMNMVNHQNGKSTLLTWSDYKFQTGLSDRDFRSQALKRLK